MNTLIYDFQEPRYISLWEFQQETMIILHAEKRDCNLYTCQKHFYIQHTIRVGTTGGAAQIPAQIMHPNQTLMSFSCVLLHLEQDTTRKPFFSLLSLFLLLNFYIYTIPFSTKRFFFLLHVGH